MKTHALLVLAATLMIASGVLAADPWTRADSKIQGNDYTNQTIQVRRSTRAYSYSPPVAAPVAPVRAQATTSAPAAQPTPAPANRAVQASPSVPVRPTTNYTQPQARSYRSYSYQPGMRGVTPTRNRSVPFYLRADSKIQGREGK